MMTLDVPEDIASADACRIEHFISAETFDKIRRFVESVKIYGKSDDRC